MKYITLCYLGCAFIFSGIWGANAGAQSLDSSVYAIQKKAVMISKGTPLDEALNSIGSKFGVSVMYRSDVVKGKNVLEAFPLPETIKKALQKILKGHQLGFKHTSDKTYSVYPKKSKKAAARRQETVSGTVTDAQTGQTLPGVNIKVKGTTTGTSTNGKGYYTLSVPSLQDTLVFSYIGYKTQTVAIDGQKNIDVMLQPSTISSQELVVVGYGKQKKENVTTSVSTINSEQISTTKSPNLINNLTGKVPGLRVMENSSEPGTYKSNFDIRGLGNPLIVIDGVKRSTGTFQRLNPESIKNISFVKDASAAVYGVKAANGVILVTTKTGEKGTLQLDYSGYVGLQAPTGFPRPVGAVDYMKLYNEKQMHNVNGGNRPYTDKNIDAYKSGKKKGANWFDAVIRKTAPQQHHVISASGGNDQTTYYFGAAYTSQRSFFESRDNHYKRYNVNSNITTHITDRLTANLKLRGIFGNRNRFHKNSWEIVGSIWRQAPIQSIYANNNPKYLQTSRVSSSNPIALMNSDIAGYYHTQNRRFNSSLTLKYKVPGIKGLTIKGLMSYDYNYDNYKTYRKKYNTYTYDEASDTFSPDVHNSPNRVRRSIVEQPSRDFQISLNYQNSINGVHNVKGLLLYEESKDESDNFYALREIALGIDQLSAGLSKNQEGNKNANNVYTNVTKGIVGRYSYNYKSKYFAKFNFRYDGSSQFYKDNQWGFFPSGSIGWQVANENFWKNSDLSFINSFKLRGSYGIVGDDASSNYQYLAGFNYPAPDLYNSYAQGYVFNGNFVNAVSSRGIPNRSLTWYESKTLDVGLDAEAWHGLLGLSFDFFKRDRSGLLTTRVNSLPDLVGANLPQENLNSDRQVGFELQVSHKNRIGQVAYNLNGNISFNRGKYRHIERPKSGNSYLDWRNNPNNRYKHIRWGYTGKGQYKSFNQMRERSKDVYVGRGTLPGDFYYKDWNEDGTIDGNDVHPISYTSQAPRINYGLSLGANYKDVSINLLFQGVSGSNVAYPEQLREPLWGGGGGGSLTEFLDRWHPKNPKVDPYDPSTEWISGKHGYTGSLPRANSTFNVHNSSYVRLKSLKVGYSIPAEATSSLGIKSFEIYFNAYNLFTISPLDEVDPEHPNSAYGYVYPLNKTYNLGLNIKF